MSAHEIVKRATEAGVRLTVEGENLVLASDKEPDRELLESIRMQKAEIIAELQAEPRRPVQRYGIPPDTSIPLDATPPRLPSDQWFLLVNHIVAQGEPVQRWALQQSNRYGRQFTTWGYEDCDAAGAIDLLLWQRNGRVRAATRAGAIREIIDLLEGIEEVMNTFRQDQLNNQGQGSAEPGSTTTQYT